MSQKLIEQTQAEVASILLLKPDSMVRIISKKHLGTFKIVLCFSLIPLLLKHFLRKYSEMRMIYRQSCS